MAEALCTYLTRLERRLLRRLSPARAEECVKEISDHLGESIAERVQRGTAIEVAEYAALRAIGPDRLVADNLTRAQSGIDDCPPWKVGWPVSLVLVGYCALYLGITFDAISYSNWTYLPWMASAAVLVLAVVCWRTRRMLWAPLSITIAAICLVVGTLQVGFSKQEFTKTLHLIDRNIIGEQAQIAHAERATAGGPLKDFRNPATGQYMAPELEPIIYEHAANWTPILIRDELRLQFELRDTASKMEARQLWTKNGSSYSQALRLGLDTSIASRRQLANEGPGPLATLPLLGSTISAAVGFLLSLLTLNAIILLLNHLYRALIKAVWRPTCRRKIAS